MPVVGILRDIPQGAEEACVNAKLKSIAKPLGIKVGAGTVRHGSDVEKAISAGAEFIVTPNTRHEVIRLSNTAGIPIIPGALTPTEVQKAYDLGATAIKIFPVNCVGGPEYIRALRGPFRDIPLMACGGVNAENAASYLKASANLLSFGGSIFNAELMKSGDWTTIEARMQKLLEAVKAAIA